MRKPTQRDEIDLLDPDAWEAPARLGEDEWADEIGVDWRQTGRGAVEGEGFDD